MDALIKAADDVDKNKDKKEELEATWTKLIDLAKTWKKGATTTAYEDKTKTLSKDLTKQKKTFDTAMTDAEQKVNDQKEKDKADTKLDAKNKALSTQANAYKKGVDDLVKT